MLVLKDVLYLVQNLVLQGGEEFQPDKYLTDRNMYYPSRKFNKMSLVGSYSGRQQVVKFNWEQ